MHYKIISMINFLQVSNKLNIFINSCKAKNFEQIKMTQANKIDIS